MSVPSYAYALSGAVAVPPFDGVLDQSRAGKQYRDVLYDPLTRDLVVAQGDLSLVGGVPSVRQEVEIRLRAYAGEWFLDTSFGVPYFQKVLIKAPNLAVIKTIFTRAILSTPGIKSIGRLLLDFNRGSRVLRVEWSASTDTSEIATGIVNLETT